uniref:hypothetical protein n=1 Tax=Ningiella ruwaisensis TaxID=2364274 RepID=UPI0010A07483|nr:hypothetical protein [Ningiella ruwaisensis]
MLSKHFCVDVYAYAVMHNHTHLVLRINSAEAKSLSNEEVLKRWGSIASLPESVKTYLKSLNQEHLPKQVPSCIQYYSDLYRERLASISWFMRILNQYIAKRANKEDNCTGHFWEGRFKSQALIGEKAVLACMAYVDLNPVRAGVSTCLNSSFYTSLCNRMRNTKIKYMKPFNSRREKNSFLDSILLKDYLSGLEKRILFGDPKVSHRGQNKQDIFERENSIRSLTYVVGDKPRVKAFRHSVRKRYLESLSSHFG